MTKWVLPVKTPFDNLKFLMTITRVLGLVSCKLVNGRLKPASIWGRCYCASWILFHFTYSSVNYYTWSTVWAAETTDVYFFLDILRFTIFLSSLLPYHCVAVVWSRDIVKFSDKLETYDDKATLLGHQRKDQHIFTWLFFTYTLAILTTKTYFAFSASIEDGSPTLFKTMCDVVFIIIGTYCVFIGVIYLDLIRQRFRHLNESIVPHVSKLPATGSQSEITVYDVRYLHGVLIDSAELINDLYGFGSLMTTISVLVEFVSVIYLLIKDMEQNHAMVTILDLSFQSFSLFAMYHLASFEANRVEESLEKYGLFFQNAKCRMDKIEMMLYFYHARFYFTAVEFYVLDLAIFLSISSTATTFITIII